MRSPEYQETGQSSAVCSPFLDPLSPPVDPSPWGTTTTTTTTTADETAAPKKLSSTAATDTDEAKKEHTPHSVGIASPGRGTAGLLSLRPHQAAAVLTLLAAVVFLVASILLNVLLYERRRLTVVESQFQLPKDFAIVVDSNDGSGPHAKGSGISGSATFAGMVDGAFDSEDDEDEEGARHIHAMRREWQEVRCQLGAFAPLLDPGLRRIHHAPLVRAFVWFSTLLRRSPLAAPHSTTESDWQFFSPLLRPPAYASPGPVGGGWTAYALTRWYYCALNPSTFPDLSRERPGNAAATVAGVGRQPRKVPEPYRAVPLEARSMAEAFCLHTTPRAQQRRARALRQMFEHMSPCGLEVDLDDGAARLPRRGPSSQLSRRRPSPATVSLTAIPSASSAPGVVEGLVGGDPGIHTILHYNQQPRQRAMAHQPPPRGRHRTAGSGDGSPTSSRDASDPDETGAEGEAALSAPHRMDFVYSVVNGTEANRLFRRTLWKNCGLPMQTLEYAWFLSKSAPATSAAERKLQRAFSAALAPFDEPVSLESAEQRRGREARAWQTVLQAFHSSAEWAKCETLFRLFSSSTADSTRAAAPSAALRNQELLSIFEGPSREGQRTPHGEWTEERLRDIREAWTATVDFTDTVVDELRFSLRSVHTYTRHWHRGRYIIVQPAAQVPLWLNHAANFIATTAATDAARDDDDVGSNTDRQGDSGEARGRHPSTPRRSSREREVSQGARLPSSFPRLHVVDQASVIPYGLSLTSNSFVIETYLYRLHGLSDLFVYINDDYFFRSRVEVSDLVNELGGPVIRLESNLIPQWDGANRDPVHHWGTTAYNTLSFNVRALDIGFIPEGDSGSSSSKHTGARRTLPQGVKLFYDDAMHLIPTSPVANLSLGQTGPLDHSVITALSHVHRHAQRGYRLAEDTADKNDNGSDEGAMARRGRDPEAASALLAHSSAAGPEELPLNVGDALRSTEDLLSLRAMPVTYYLETYHSYVKPRQRYLRSYETHSPFVICRNMHRHLHTRLDLLPRDPNDATGRRPSVPPPSSESEGTEEQWGSSYALAWRAWAHRERNNSDLLLPFVYTDHMLRAPWAASAKYLPYLAAKQQYFGSAAGTAGAKPTPAAGSPVNNQPPSVTIDLDNRDGCAPPTILVGESATQAVYQQFGDVDAENQQTMTRLSRKGRHLLFTNINGKYSRPEVGQDLRRWMEREYPQALPIEQSFPSSRTSTPLPAAGVQEWFRSLMSLPLLLITRHREGFCPLLRSLQTSLPQYGAGNTSQVILVAVDAHSDRSASFSKVYAEGKRRHAYRHFMPVAACDHTNPANVKKLVFLSSGAAKSRLVSDDGIITMAAPSEAVSSTRTPSPKKPTSSSKRDSNGPDKQYLDGRALRSLIRSVLTHVKLRNSNGGGGGGGGEGVALFPSSAAAAAAEPFPSRGAHPGSGSAHTSLPPRRFPTKRVRALVLDTRDSASIFHEATLAMPGQLLALEDFRVLELSGSGGDGEDDDDSVALVLSRGVDELAQELPRSAPTCVCPAPSPSQRRLPALRFYPISFSSASQPNASSSTRRGGARLTSCRCDSDDAGRRGVLSAPPVHWVMGATEKDLLAQYPLPYLRFEQPDGEVRWLW